MPVEILAILLSSNSKLKRVFDRLIDWLIDWLIDRQLLLFSAGRPPLCQMPFVVTPEGKILAQSGAIMKYICKKAGNKTNIGSGAFCLKGQKELDVYSVQLFGLFP